jgi:hypothetical protein
MFCSIHVSTSIGAIIDIRWDKRAGLVIMTKSLHAQPSQSCKLTDLQHETSFPFPLGGGATITFTTSRGTTPSNATSAPVHMAALP